MADRKEGRNTDVTLASRRNSDRKWIERIRGRRAGRH